MQDTNNLNKYLSRVITFFQKPALRPVLIITFFSFFSRFLGFVRQFLIYTRLSKLESDLLLSANKIPEQISVILLMGTVYSSVLPIASQIQNDTVDKSKVDTQVSGYLQIINLSLLAVLLFLCLLLGVFMRPILQVFSETLWQEAIVDNRLAEYILAGRILLLLPIIFSIQATLGVFLTIKKRFLVYSLAGIFSNLGSITALAFSEGDFIQVAIGMVIGGLAANIVYLIDCLGRGLIIPKFDLTTIKQLSMDFKSKITKTWSLFLPRILVIDGFYTANLVINPINQYKGQVTAFDLGTSIQGAFFIIITALGTVFFPNLSELFYNKDIPKETFWRQMMRYLKVSILLGLGVTVVTIILSPVVMWLFGVLGQGQGTEQYVVRIAQISSLSLVFRAMREILSKYIYVRQRQWQPMYLSIVGILALVITTLVLVDFQVDAGIATSFGLVSYNFFWVVAALTILFRDKRLATQTKDE
jgi:peptidoglycan biosynthesis protein MviN/MurJ (putative lipid II flippase)